MKKDSEILKEWADEGRESDYLELDVLLPDQEFKFYELLDRAAIAMEEKEQRER